MCCYGNWNIQSYQELNIYLLTYSAIILTGMWLHSLLLNSLIFSFWSQNNQDREEGCLHTSLPQRTVQTFPVQG